MSIRKLFGTLSGTQVTILGCVALLAPTALYAAVDTNLVSLMDPLSGTFAYIDSGRRLYTYDPIAGYEHNPSNIVNGEITAGDRLLHPIYVVPTGKALVVKSLIWNYSGNSPETDSRIQIKDANGIQKLQLDTLSAAGSLPINFGTGLLFNSGSVNINFSGAGVSQVYFQGYLIPTAAIALPGSATASAQSSTTTK